MNGAAEREAAAPTVSPTAQAAPPWMKELQRAQIKRNSRPGEPRPLPAGAPSPAPHEHRHPCPACGHSDRGSSVRLAAHWLD